MVPPVYRKARGLTQDELYEHKPKVVDSKDWEKFVEMCFDPESPVNARLKDMLLDMMGGNTTE